MNLATPSSITRLFLLCSIFTLGFSTLANAAASTQTVLSDPWGIATLPITQGHIDASQSYRKKSLEEKKSGQASGYYDVDGMLPLLRTFHAKNRDEKCEYIHYELKKFQNANKATTESIAIAFAIAINRSFEAELRNNLYLPDMGEFYSRMRFAKKTKLGKYSTYQTLQEYGYSNAKARTGNSWVRYSIYRRIPASLRPSSKSKFFFIQSCLSYGNPSENKAFIKRVSKASGKLTLLKPSKKQREKSANAAAQGELYTHAYGNWLLQCPHTNSRLGECKLVQNFNTENRLQGLALKMSLSIDPITERMHLLIQPFFDINAEKSGKLQFGEKGTWNIKFVKCKRKRCIASGRLSKAQIKALKTSQRIGIQVPVSGDHERWFNTSNKGIREGLRKLSSPR